MPNYYCNLVKFCLLILYDLGEAIALVFVPPALIAHAFQS